MLLSFSMMARLSQLLILAILILTTAVSGAGYYDDESLNCFSLEEGLLLPALDVLNSNSQVAENFKIVLTDRVNSQNNNPNAPFIAQVESDYWDEPTKTWITVSGMGSLVSFTSEDSQGRKAAHLALLSASHVTQGLRLRVRDGEGKIIPIIPGQRLANVDEDVELILLNDRRSTPLSYDEKEKVFRSQVYDFAKMKLDKLGPGIIKYNGFNATLKHHIAAINLGDSFYVGEDPHLRSDVFILQATSFFKGQSLKEKAESIWNSLGEMQRPLIGRGLISSGDMPPGYSGAPLIRDIPKADMIEKGLYAYQIEGLVLAQHREEKKTFYADQNSISDLLTSFRQGRRNYISATRWRMRDGFIFRDYGNGRLEANFAKIPSASFFKTESGNAVSVDSGNAISIDSGKINKTRSKNILLGMQESYGTKTVGKLLERKGLLIPALAGMGLEQDAAKLGLKSIAEISQQSDLYKLAQIKYSFVNNKGFTLEKNVYQCEYQLDESGASVSIIRQQTSLSETTRDLVGTVRISRDQMSKGFDPKVLNQKVGDTPGGMMHDYKDIGVYVDLAGLFVTDLTSASSLESLDGVLGPTVNLGFNKNTPCFKNHEEYERALNQFKNDYYKSIYKSANEFYHLMGIDYPESHWRIKEATREKQVRPN